MITWRRTPKMLLAALLAAPALFATSHATIVKCRDAAGQWHYGDHAARACGHHPAYVLDTEGVETKTPATGSQGGKAGPQATQTKAQAADKRLLATYGSAHAITQARNRAIAALEKQRQGDMETLKILQQTLAHMQSTAALARQPSATLLRDITETESQITAEQQTLNSEAATEQAVRLRYAGQRKRFLVLKAPAS
ncbi:MAG: hypothetical protein ACYCXT_03400 [Acidiferrobacteraceae bacterium]